MESLKEIDNKMKLLVLVLCLVGLSLCALDCSETACIAIYEYCEDSCHTYSGCCPSCCEEPCAECLVSPCDDWACDGHPEFTCRDDYCGGCNRIWFDGNGARTECENEVFGVGPCTRACPVVDFCAGCGTVRDGCCEVCCEESCAECFVDPCEGYSCQGYPGYSCRSNYCGGCNRDWIDSNGEPVTCAVEIFGEHACATVDCMSIDAETCGCGLAPTDGCCLSCCEGACASCLVEPCEGYTCLDNENYTCESNYCGGCNRLWYDENGNRAFCSNESNEPIDCSAVMCALVELDCPCGVTTVGCCPACIEEVNCFANPCDNMICADNSEYTCEANYCGGCNRDWFDRAGNPVECKNEEFSDCSEVMCTMIALECGPCGETTIDCCPACVPEADCLVNPCDSVTCASHPEYTCEANYCGGCNRDWFGKDGEKVECEREIFNADWVLECARDVDCALQNVDHGFGCCYEGACDNIDFAIDSWRPVNREWWQSQHDACSVNCGPQPGCPSIEPENQHFVAICKNAQCMKVNSLVVHPSFSEPSSDDAHSDSNTVSRSSNDSSSAEVLVSFWAFIVALVLVAL